MGRKKRLVNRARPSILGSKYFLLYLKMVSVVARISAGRKVQTLTMLRNTPLASTTPRSRPMRKLMKTSMIMPTTVVMPEERMEGMAWASADFMADTRSV